MRETATRWILMLVFGLCLAHAVPAGEAPPATPLGVVHDEDPVVAGTLETTGRVLADGEMVKTLERRAIVTLDNGRVLKLDPNSAARLEDAGAGDVAVTVFSGRVTVLDANGRPMTAGQRSSFTLSPALEDVAGAEQRLLETDDGWRARRAARPTREATAGARQR